MVNQADEPQTAREEPRQHEVPVQAHLQLGPPPQWLQETRRRLGVQQHLQALQVCLFRLLLLFFFFKPFLDYFTQLCDSQVKKKMEQKQNAACLRREESSLVDQFVFEILVIFVESLGLAHSDEPSMGNFFFQNFFWLLLLVQLDFRSGGKRFSDVLYI